MAIFYIFLQIQSAFQFTKFCGVFINFCFLSPFLSRFFLFLNKIFFRTLLLVFDDTLYDKVFPALNFYFIFQIWGAGAEHPEEDAIPRSDYMVQYVQQKCKICLCIPLLAFKGNVKKNRFMGEIHKPRLTFFC